MTTSVCADGACRSTNQPKHPQNTPRPATATTSIIAKNQQESRQSHKPTKSPKKKRTNGMPHLGIVGFEIASADKDIKEMKAIIDNSFLKDHMKGLGGMPKGVRKLIALLEP
jgi:hypothetical protein